MHPRYLGDDYDIVKREIMQALAPSEPWSVHPMYFDHEGKVQQNFLGRYASFLRARLVPGNIWDRDAVVSAATQCRTHLLLDPDSGIWLGKNLQPIGGWLKHLKGAELVQIVQEPSRESKLTLVFADTQRDNFGSRHKRIRGMLDRIGQRHGIHGNGYVSSRVALVWVSMDGELVKAATERLVSNLKIPRWRMVDSGHRVRAV